jgi:hypothetical protein
VDTIVRTIVCCEEGFDNAIDMSRHFQAVHDHTKAEADERANEMFAGLTRMAPAAKPVQEVKK